MDALGRSLDRTELSQEAGGHPWLLSQVLYRMWDGASLEDALEQTDQEEVERHYPVWQRQLGRRGLELLVRIPEAGIPLEQFTRRGSMRAFRSVLPLLLALCLVELDSTRVRPGPRLFLDWLGEQP